MTTRFVFTPELQKTLRLLLDEAVQSDVEVELDDQDGNPVAFVFLQSDSQDEEIATTLF